MREHFIIEWYDIERMSLPPLSGTADSPRSMSPRTRRDLLKRVNGSFSSEVPPSMTNENSSAAERFGG